VIPALLGPTAGERRMADLEQSRAYAVDDSAAALRRIERDLHGRGAGPAGGAGDEAGHGPGQAGRGDRPGGRDLLDTAHRNAKEAIVELRDLARASTRPVLDQGLDAALATLAATSAVPVRLRVDVPRRPSPAVETIAYFCAAELLTNVAKHSGARYATVEVEELEGRLRMRVHDDGVGGVREGAGCTGWRNGWRTVDGRWGSAVGWWADRGDGWICR